MRRAMSPRLLLVSVVTAAVAVLGLAVSAGAAGGRADSGTAWLSANHTAGGLLIVSGDIKDKLLGNGAIVYRVKASPAGSGTFKVSSKSVTLYTAGGSLSGTGSATQTVAPDGSATVSDGKVNLTHGTGSLKGHSLAATFSGPFKDGVYTFTYKGTYK